MRPVERVLEIARNHLSRGASPVNPIRDRIEQAFHAFLGDSARHVLGRQTAWHTLLWNDLRRTIFTALGDFSSSGWNVRFEPGFGIAGHSFRFRRPACFHSGTPGDESLIFQDRTDVQGPYSYKYRWVVCAPILDENGSAVGIFSVAAPEAETAGDRHLARLAQDFVRQEPDAITALDRLSSAVSVAFWIACSELEELDVDDRNQARAVCEALIAIESRVSSKPPSVAIDP
jgi:hypothetical protein